MATLLRHRYLLIKNTRTKARSRLVDLVTTNKLKHGLPLIHRIIQWMVKEDRKRCSTNNQVRWKAFPVVSNKLNGLFSKISLRIHQTYKKREKLLETRFLRKFRGCLCKELRRLTRWNSLTRKRAFNWLHVLNLYH